MRERIFRYLPQELAQELAGQDFFREAEELRIRAERRVIYHARGREFLLGYIPDLQAVRKMILAFSEHSMAAFYDELRQGFFTVAGGIRIGVAGRVVSEGGNVKMIRDYTALNIRFPREFIGISAPILPYLQKENRFFSTLILSPPQCGKTTLLRDLIRAVSDGDGCLPKKCSVIDERSEISGGRAFDLGLRTDVLLGCPKAEGMRMALRSLSPQVIATDEIGSRRDLEMLCEASVSGVKVIATAHAESREELMQKLFFQKICGADGVIERMILLSETLGRGTVQQIYDAAGGELLPGPVSISGIPHA